MNDPWSEKNEDSSQFQKIYFVDLLRQRGNNFVGVVDTKVEFTFVSVPERDWSALMAYKLG